MESDFYDDGLQRPNKFRADRHGDIVNQEFYYDGKNLTLYMTDQNYYATVEAPPTIEQAIDFAREYLNVFAPVGDLIRFRLSQSARSRRCCLKAAPRLLSMG